MLDGYTEIQATDAIGTAGVRTTFLKPNFMFAPGRLPASGDTHQNKDRPDTAQVERRFADLVRRWKKETQVASDPTSMFMTSSYLGLIGLGPAAISLLLEELAREPNHWFVALTAITAENPVPKRDAGDVAAMTRHWLNWGTRKGYR
jgi:hypothetical protein